MSENNAFNKNPDKHPLGSMFYWVSKLRTTLLFSFVINLLYLTGPIFMMQVYDRVLASANMPTLIGLTLIAVLLYTFFGTLEYIKGLALKSNSEAITDGFASRGYQVAILNDSDRQPSKEKKQALKDVNTLRSFLTSGPFSAFFDLPWAPIFLIFVFGLHVGLGVIALIACIVLGILAVINERLSRDQLEKSSGIACQSSSLAEHAQRNAVTLRANGMISTIGVLWKKTDHQARETQFDGAVINFGFATMTKTLRMMIQSLMLAAGAYFVIKGELSPGSIIASSVIFSRALAPLEQILGGYSMLINARQSWGNIKTWAFETDHDQDKQVLPSPCKSFNVIELWVMTPDKKTPILTNIQFTLNAGDVLGVSGPSGSGKSTLAKTIVGAWPTIKGRICLDGADIQQWPRDTLGNYIGYLPQEIELFDGTVAQNIARFKQNADFNHVLKASELADTHQLILNLENGYNTQLGPSGIALSAGQRQRIALARALYADPFFVVLDEPNSNLDSQGEKALSHAVESIRLRGGITVLITHRQNILDKTNKLLIIQQGEMKAFGTPDDIVKAVKALKNSVNTNKHSNVASINL